MQSQNVKKSVRVPLTRHTILEDIQREQQLKLTKKNGVRTVITLNSIFNWGLHLFILKYNSHNKNSIESFLKKEKEKKRL